MNELFDLEKNLEDNYSYPIRPQSFKDYTGQKKIIDNLSVYVKAARKRNSSLDHCLFYGPPGLGKTTLASIVAKELGVNIQVTSAPAIDHAGTLSAILTNLGKYDILFIDEIHRLNPLLEEKLYPAMEDFKLDIIIGQGPAARTVQLDLPPFTLIGATTKKGALGNPFLDRFGIIERLEYYNRTDLSTIIMRASELQDIRIELSASLLIADSSRGTPRVAHRLLRRMRDFAEVLGDGYITENVVKEGLNRLQIDLHGLDASDRDYLTSAILKYNGGPVGLETLSAILSEEIDTIESVIEPYLIMRGLVHKTPRGRIITQAGYKAVGFEKRTAD